MRRPGEFESLSDVVERLEQQGFSTDKAHRAIRDILRDRRYLKRVSWADAATGAVTDYELVRVVGAPSVDDISWNTSSFKNPRLDGRGRRLEKIEVLISDLKWYSKWEELSGDPRGPTRASPPALEPKDVHEGSAQRVAGERAAIKALASHLKNHTDITRADARKWLVQQGFAVNPRGFQFRVWPEGRTLAGLLPIAPPGAKKKSSRGP
jgi:hypothetical protein